ncbi:hypothetical protein AFL01nite_00220 [Aeromicrobium flavum]|uniref:AB hydrolase-1 domain-containing protein n=1 Tax=Aeromicrobium flavum TaxID=416568 RepID=A0A512HQG7_9ACTN|nr:alpha/beta fold hydrolase [Aeromicrobium flavum]GEO87695.1 hypothetical protein AFL01nite_00220 [Aeromicrobium flavum]
MIPFLLTHDAARGILLFAPGAGGDPTRYERLLTAANEAGFIVAAPAHDLAESYPDDVLRGRVAALQALLSEIARDELPVVAAGHSLGGFAAVSLAGGRPRDLDGRLIEVPSVPRIAKVVVLAPAAGWFRGPDALTDVTVSVTAFVGSEDDVTPPESAEVLSAALAGLDLRRYEGVGHFDFMAPLPPNKVPVVDDHDAFYERFTQHFVAALG